MSGIALLLGLPSEPPIVAVRRALETMGAPFLVLDQRKLLRGSVDVHWTESGASGEIVCDGTTLRIADVSGVYTRLTSWGDLPEVASEPAMLAKAHWIHTALEAWLETTTRVPVVNRTSANDSNHSKPYQALIIRDYFDVPATLVTNSASAVRAFEDEYGRVIYKSVSGERSIVSLLSEADADRFSLLANGPVQFQEYVPGVDVRVHVVRGEVFATAVESDAIDYRYASTIGAMHDLELGAGIARACVDLTARLDLELAGIDLRFAEDGRIICFEANPSPAFTAYEDVDGGRVARAVAARLVETATGTRHREGGPSRGAGV